MIPDLARFQISVADALEAGGWQPPDKIQTMSASSQRQALVDALCRISGQPKAGIEKLSDYDLAAQGAVTAFLLQMGIRGEAGLKGRLDDHRNTLIVEVAKNGGYPGGQGLDNYQLVRRALEPTSENKFAVRGGMVMLRERLFGTEKIVPLKRLFDMTLDDVLRAGNWLTPHELKSKSPEERRQVLIEQLGRIRKLPPSAFSSLADDDLIGGGAVVAFLLQTGIRGEADWNDQVEAGGRNTLIVEVAKNVGYPGGQGLTNQQLVWLALEPTPRNRFVLRGNLPAFRDRLYNLPFQSQRLVIGLAAEAAGYADMWSSIGERLHWLFRLLKAASKDYPLTPGREHPQKALSKAIQPSVWAADQNYLAGLDYYGFTPQFVPRLSLDTYLTAFEKSAELLEKIETKHDEYFAAWNDQAAATEHLRTVLDSAKDHVSFLSRRIGELKKELNDTKTSIDTYDNKRKVNRDAVKEALKDCEAEVKRAFGLSAETFFNCLSQLGFANFSEPARALKAVSTVGGIRQGGFGRRRRRGGRLCRRRRHGRGSGWSHVERGGHQYPQ